MSRRRNRAARIALWTLGSCVAAVILVCLGLVAAVHLGTAEFDATEQPWVACPIEHPGSTPPIALLQRSLHPFLAEYEYKIRFADGEDAVERWLPMNVGGRTRMNAYWYPRSDGSGPSIRLEDHWGETLVRLDERRTYRLIRFRGGVWAGEIRASREGHGTGTTGPAGGPYEFHVTVGGRDAVEITNTAPGRGPGAYFGRIQDRRFLPAAQAPEERIPRAIDGVPDLDAQFAEARERAHRLHAEQSVGR